MATHAATSPSHALRLNAVEIMTCFRKEFWRGGRNNIEKRMKLDVEQLARPACGPFSTSSSWTATDLQAGMLMGRLQKCNEAAWFVLLPKLCLIAVQQDSHPFSTALIHSAHVAKNRNYFSS